MEATPCLMAYEVEIGPKASAQLSELDPMVASAVGGKIIWLSQNAADVIHRAPCRYAGRFVWPVQITNRRLAHPLLDISGGESYSNLPN